MCKKPLIEETLKEPYLDEVSALPSFSSSSIVLVLVRGVGEKLSWSEMILEFYFDESNENVVGMFFGFSGVLRFCFAK